MNTYRYNLDRGNYFFRRWQDQYADNELIDGEAHWKDAIQGDVGNCYIVAAMSTVAEFPTLIQDMFVTPQRNDAGIYVIRFFIRGKPWYVDVDDFLLWVKGNSRNNYEPTLKFASPFGGASGGMWGPIIEKAWSKVKGTYSNSDAGVVASALRSLIGAPNF